LSNIDYLHLASSGRQSLYAPSRSVEYMRKLLDRGAAFPGVQELMDALHAGISNPNTARELLPADANTSNPALTARSPLDEHNEFAEADLAGLLKTDLAAQALAKINAQKGDAKAPAIAIPVPQLPPLPKEAEARRHELAQARIDADTREEADRLAANKAPRKAQLVASFRCTALGGHEGAVAESFLEFHRYRAYQDQVTPAVWEQMKNNLWQRVCRTETVSSSADSGVVYPTVVWSVEALCASEYDRPILVKAFSWGKLSKTSTWLGEVVTTLRELTEQGRAPKEAKGLEILNEQEAKRNPRSYRHSGVLHVSKAEVKVSRSLVAIRTIVSAVQSKVSLEEDDHGKEDLRGGGGRGGGSAMRGPPKKVLQPTLTKHSGWMAGMGVGQYVYSECLVWLTLKAERLDKDSMISSMADPIVEVWRVNPAIPLKDGQYGVPLTPADYVRVYASERREHTLSPEWRPFVLSMKELCTGNVLCPLIVRVHDAGALGGPELIGEFAVDLYTLLCKGPSGDGRFTLVHPTKMKSATSAAPSSSYKGSGTLQAKVKLLSKFELVGKDAQLLEDLAVKAPFLLGWQPGLELKNLSKNNKNRRGPRGSHIKK